MSESASNSTSKTNWARVDALSDKEIDTSEAPSLGESFFRRASWQHPKPVSVTLEVDADVLAWFQAQGKEVERRMAAVLRIYAESHKRN